MPMVKCLWYTVKGGLPFREITRLGGTSHHILVPIAVPDVGDTRSGTLANTLANNVDN